MATSEVIIRPFGRRGRAAMVVAAAAIAAGSVGVFADDVLESDSSPTRAEVPAATATINMDDPLISRFGDRATDHPELEDPLISRYGHR